MKDEYWGEVIDVNDTTKSGKIKVAVVSIFDDIPIAHVPWAIPRFYGRRTHDLPAVGQIVRVKFAREDIYQPMWFESRGTDNMQTLADEDYASATVLIDKDLTQYQLDGRVQVTYTESEGIKVALTKEDIQSLILLRPDNSIQFTNGKTGHIVHLSDESISLGSETSSAEPGVLGDSNEVALNNLNNTVQTLTNTMISGLAALSASATATPFTTHLAPSITALQNQLQTQIEQLHQQNADQFPSTKSEIVTTD